MSGHSHWKTIKFKKGAADAKKGQAFSKLAREISMIAKEGGKDITFNAKLRMVIEKARSFNMPADNIERAIKKGAGELEGGTLESVLFEGYGPGGVAIIVEGITDNKNRTFNEIRQILTQNGGKFVGEGGVKWMFDRKGVIIVSHENKEEAELAAIEAGADDVSRDQGFLDVYTKPEEIEKVKRALEEKGLKIESASIGWVAKENIAISETDKKACEKLFEALDGSDDVQEIYSNFKE
ncbi:MAG: Transcriptional regulator [Parcubacteria group bacterium GW2011_GWF2_43_11]|nr:MAG: Transcriptional regulator [Parcubacteria group bacterium GW2011_GWF2_43_11]